MIIMCKNVVLNCFHYCSIIMIVHVSVIIYIPVNIHVYVHVHVHVNGNDKYIHTHTLTDADRHRQAKTHTTVISYSMKLTQYHHIVHAMFYKSVPLLTNHEELEMIRHEEQAVRK